MTDLRALFSSNDPIDASEAFTNRQRQWELVATALAEHLRHTSAGFDPTDLEAPRNHLIVFHGVGGVGKTTLVRKLEAALGGTRPAQWGEQVWGGHTILPVRIDLSRSAGTTFEDVVLTIRAALAVSFADPVRADDELALAHQLLDGLDQRSNTLLAQVVALIKDAGTDGVTDRAQTLHTDIDNAGLPFLHRFVELALAFQHAVRGEDEDLAAVIDRLRALTATGDFAYFTDITHFMAGLPLPEPSTTRWTTSEDDVRSSWRGLVQARQEVLRAGN